MTTNHPSTEIALGISSLTKGGLGLQLMCLHQEIPLYLWINAAFDRAYVYLVMV